MRQIPEISSIFLIFLTFNDIYQTIFFSIFYGSSPNSDEFHQFFADKSQNSSMFCWNEMIFSSQNFGRFFAEIVLAVSCVRRQLLQTRSRGVLFTCFGLFQPIGFFWKATRASGHCRLGRHARPLVFQFFFLNLERCKGLQIL